MFLYNEEEESYAEKIKYKKQIIKIKIYVEMWNAHKGKEVRFWVDARIQNKNKRFAPDGISTGKYGVEMLLVIQKELFSFMEDIKTKEIRIPSYMEEIGGKKIYLFQVGWADNKRKRAYRRLLRYGFKERVNCYEKVIKETNYNGL